VWYDPAPVKRLARIMLNALTVLSLLLCVAAAALWTRSLRTRDVMLLNFMPPPGEKRTQWHLCAAAGEARMMRVRGPIGFAHPPGRVWWSEPLDGRPWSWVGTDSPWGLLGASVHFGGMGRDAVVGPNTYYRISYGALVLPLWMPTIVFAILPSVWSLRRRRGPAALNACACGYDLRATPERCPECGTVPGR
jgi:hypothetical protein